MVTEKLTMMQNANYFKRTLISYLLVLVEKCLLLVGMIQGSVFSLLKNI